MIPKINPSSVPRGSSETPRLFLRSRVLGLLTAFLDAVISSLSFESRRLMRVSLVHPARSECIRFSFASAVLECDDGSVGALSELHAAVFCRLEKCPNWAVKFAYV